MFKIIAVTNRELCIDLNEKLKEIAAAQPDMIVLRDKTLNLFDYNTFADYAVKVCGSVPIIMHNYVATASRLNKPILLTTAQLTEGAAKLTPVRFGVSCHSLDDVLYAQDSGCEFVVVGHIFDTACKNTPGRGIAFLEEICGKAAVPVYAIGGISADNIAKIVGAGASGACVMSGIMTAKNAKEYVAELRRKANIGSAQENK